MDAELRSLKQRQLASLKARETIDDEAAAAIKRLEGELAERGDGQAVDLVAQLRDELVAERKAHAETRGALERALEAAAKAAPAPRQRTRRKAK